MPNEFIGCSRKVTNRGWSNGITVTMYNMGQYSEDHYSQCLTIDEAKKLCAELQALIAASDKVEAK